jgi:hypothetical protein
VLPLLTLFLLGIIQYGFGLFQLQSFTSSLTGAATLAGTGVESCAQLDTRLRSLVDGAGAALDADDVGDDIRLEWLAPSGSTLTTSGAPERLQFAKVTASFKPFRIGAPLIPFPEEITRSSTVQVQNILASTLRGCG